VGSITTESSNKNEAYAEAVVRPASLRDVSVDVLELELKAVMDAHAAENKRVPAKIIKKFKEQIEAASKHAEQELQFELTQSQGKKRKAQDLSQKASKVAKTSATAALMQLSQAAAPLVVGHIWAGDSQSEDWAAAVLHNPQDDPEPMQVAQEENPFAPSHDVQLEEIAPFVPDRVEEDLGAASQDLVPVEAARVEDEEQPVAASQDLVPVEAANQDVVQHQEEAEEGEVQPIAASQDPVEADQVEEEEEEKEHVEPDQVSATESDQEDAPSPAATPVRQPKQKGKAKKSAGKLKNKGGGAAPRRPDARTKEERAAPLIFLKPLPVLPEAVEGYIPWRTNSMLNPYSGGRSCARDAYTAAFGESNASAAQVKRMRAANRGTMDPQIADVLEAQGKTNFQLQKWPRTWEELLALEDGCYIVRVSFWDCVSKKVDKHFMFVDCERRLVFDNAEEKPIPFLDRTPKQLRKRCSFMSLEQTWVCKVLKSAIAKTKYV